MSHVTHGKRKPSDTTAAWTPPTADTATTSTFTPSSPVPSSTEQIGEVEQVSQEPIHSLHHFGNVSLFAPDPAAAPAAPPAGGDGFGGPAGDAPLVQASLRVNAPDDAFEQEADSVADMVMRSPAASDDLDTTPADPIAALRVQRASDEGGGLQTTPEVETSISQMQGGGSPIPATDRSFFEQRMGHDFSQIRIHTDNHAAQTARNLNARAFTVGNDIAFDAGEYQPGTSSGRHLLAHELTHTIQQTGGVATKRVQRKQDEPEQAEEAPEPEEEAPQQSPADLLALAQQTLTEDEVSAQTVAPVEAQPVDLPETVIEDEGGGAGGGGGGAAEAAPAVAEQAAAEQKLAEAEKAAQAAQSAPSGAAAANQPAPQPAPSGSSPAAGAAAEATQAAASEAPPVEQKTEQKAETAPSGETTPAAAGGEANAPQAQSAAANQPEAKTAEDRNDTAQQTEDKQTDTREQPEDETADKREQPEDETADKREQKAGAGQQAEAEPDEDEERATTVQRFPAGQMIQRAPRSPDADPAFQAVTATLKTTAAGQKQHDPAKQKADEAAAAAKMPQEEKLGAAQNTQTGAIDSAAAAQQQQAADGSAPGFDKAAFKAQVKARIDELTPKDPKQMEDIEGSGVFGNVQSAVNEKVETGKDQAQGNVDDKVNESPDPSAVPDKPTNPLQPNAPGAAPGAVDATGAAPKPHDPAEVEAPLQAESQGLDTKMASAQVTPEQLQTSNEPQFQTALEAKTSAQAHVTEALPQYRATEQGQIQGAQAEAGTLTQTGVGAMFQTRSGSFGQMDTLQKGAQTEDEQKRARIGQQIDGIYQTTKTAVAGILTELDTAVDQCFTSGADRAKQAAIDYIKRETDAYKERRYSGEDSGWGVVGGLVNRVDDGLTGMPDEYFEYYRQGRDLYVAEMDGVLDQVADIVASHLKRAHDRVQQGRNEITRFVESQPEELREVAQQAAEDAEGKFDELDETITAKQDEIIDSLAQKYVEKLQALDSELEAMKEAEKGLLAKAADMIEGVIQTIGELKDLLLNTLQRAAGAVMKILQDPIGFLGNLLSAVGQGLRQFAGNIGTHLQQGLISWLTGALAGGGIQLPATWDLQGIFSLVMQILGLTYAQIRARIVQALGPIGEQVIGALEQAWDVFQIIQSEGLAGLWNFIADQVGDLQAMVLDQIKDMVITQVIGAGIEWLVGVLGGPAGAFIKAVQAIVRVVTWFVNNAARLASLVNSVIDSVMAIASGDIGGAASHIEQSLAKALPTVIGFLADLLGLGGISQKVQQIITKVRAPIEKAITWLVQKAVALGKKLWGMLKGKGKDKDKPGEAEGPDERSKDQKQADLDAAISEAEGLLSAKDTNAATVRDALPGIKARYKLTSLELVKAGENSYYAQGKVNPEKKTRIHSIGGLDLSDQEIMQMVRRIATNIYNDEQSRVGEQEMQETERRRQEMRKSGQERLEQHQQEHGSNDGFRPEDKELYSRDTVVSTRPEEAATPSQVRYLREQNRRGVFAPMHLQNSSHPQGASVAATEGWDGAPFVKGVGTYAEIATQMAELEAKLIQNLPPNQQRGMRSRMVAAIRTYSQTGIVPIGFAQQVRNQGLDPDLLIGGTATLMLSVESVRNPANLVTAPMMLDLISSGKMNWSDVPSKFPMGPVGAVADADTINKELGFNDLMLKQDRKTHKPGTKDYADVEAAKTNEVNIVVEWVTDRTKNQKFDTVAELEAFIEGKIREFHRMRPKK